MIGLYTLIGDMIVALVAVWRVAGGVYRCCSVFRLAVSNWSHLPLRQASSILGGDRLLALGVTVRIGRNSFQNKKKELYPPLKYKRK